MSNSFIYQLIGVFSSVEDLKDAGAFPSRFFGAVTHLCTNIALRITCWLQSSSHPAKLSSSLVNLIAILLLIKVRVLSLNVGHVGRLDDMIFLRLSRS